MFYSSPLPGITQLIEIYYLRVSGPAAAHDHVDVPVDRLGSLSIREEPVQVADTSLRLLHRDMAHGRLSRAAVSHLHYLCRFGGK